MNHEKKNQMGAQCKDLLREQSKNLLFVLSEIIADLNYTDSASVTEEGTENGTGAPHASGASLCAAPQPICTHTARSGGDKGKFLRILMSLILAWTLLPLHAQYIAEVLEYVPAPSQYMNAAPWSTPSSPASIIGTVHGSLSLGAFGGYVVFRFEEPVENDPGHPFGVDFTIFGNPIPNWSEPGIVSVMKDENGNGLPDDTWYELAGSDHNFSTTIKDYSVTYENPETDSATDVPWTDNQGNSGVIAANSFYSQPYYPLQDSFPGISRDRYTLSGTMIRSTVDTGFASGIYSLKRAFGYVDNQFRGAPPYTLPDNPYTPEVENAGGDAFDISWAVDEEGNYVELDRVHFIKIHSALNDGAGWLGQISTEITGAALVESDHSVTGNRELLVIREIPPVLDTSEYQLEVFAFTGGKLNTTEQIRWTSSMPEASVDNQNILHVNSSGDLTITASLASNAAVSTSVSTFIDLALDHEERMHGQASFSVYPNPARDFIMLEGVPEGYTAQLHSNGTAVRCNDHSDQNTQGTQLNKAVQTFSGTKTGQTGQSLETSRVTTDDLPFIRIFNISGKQVFAARMEDAGSRLQIHDLQPGIYMVTVTTGTCNATAKFIKQ